MQIDNDFTLLMETLFILEGTMIRKIKTNELNLKHI